MSPHDSQDEFQIFYCGIQNHITFLVSTSGHCSPPQPSVLLYTYIHTHTHTHTHTHIYIYIYIGFPNGSGGKEFAYNVADTRDMGSIPRSGRSPGGGNGNPLQYSCLENSMGRGPCWAKVQRVTKNWTQLSSTGASSYTNTYSCSRL